MSAATPGPTEGGIDFSRRFLPEAFTPLFHTELYGGLPEAVQLRYNQLQGLYFNEQVQFFEQEMLTPMLCALQKQALPPELAGKLAAFIEDERRHTAMFRELNLQSAPDLYASGPYTFIRVPHLGKALIHGMSGQPRLFPLIAWLTLLQEERALFYSKGCLEEAAELEPHFLATHRAHLADEVGHVRVDEELLDWLWPRSRSLIRFLNARLLGWMIGEFFLLPKRAGRQVVEQLAREFPHLDAGALIQALEGLGADTAYLCTLYSRDITPRSFRRFDAEPSFHGLSRVLPGFLPAGTRT